MARIDDPLEQAHSQHPSESPGILSSVTALAALVAQLHPAGASIALGLTAANVVGEFFSRRAINERMETLLHYMGAKIDNSVTAAKVDGQMQDPAAQEAVITAAWQTIRTPSQEKIRRFGEIIGSTLSDDSPDWERATEFVRDLEQLNAHDLAALHMLWSVQYQQEAEPGRMHTDANRYTGQWNMVLGFAAQHLRWHHDELYSRCARLTGFGLALEVQRNGSHQGPGDHCFRVTGKAVQLLRMLGMKPHDVASPEYRFEVLGRRS